MVLLFFFLRLYSVASETIKFFSYFYINDNISAGDYKDIQGYLLSASFGCRCRQEEPTCAGAGQSKRRRGTPHWSSYIMNLLR